MKETVLITGATAGIGYEFARLFARDQYNLVLVARNEERLKRCKQEFEREFGVAVEALATDLSQTTAVKEIGQFLEERNLAIDILVNNAGFGLQGRFLSSDLETELQMIEVNVAALTGLCKLVLPGMVARGKGNILNVASTAAFLPGPTMAVYYATKAYVFSFSLALSREVRRQGVTVSVLCPGPTKTEFQQRAGVRMHPLARLLMHSPKKVAAIGYRGLLKGKKMIVPGIFNKGSWWFARFAPLWLQLFFIENFHGGSDGQ